MGLVMSIGIGITLVFGTSYWFEVDFYMFECMEQDDTWFRDFYGTCLLGTDITMTFTCGIGLDITMVQVSQVLTLPWYFPVVLVQILPWYKFPRYWHNHDICTTY